jgi:hypothetical protein
MTLIKSLLLGSAATLFVVAGAQAADLPTKKGAPAAEYVRICKIDGIAGFVIPGSDTCLKISGGVNAQFTGGNVNTTYLYPARSRATSRVDSKYRADIGWYTRGEVDFTAVSNTAYGPLLSYVGLRMNMGSGLDTPDKTSPGVGYQNNNGATQDYLANAYIQWAGLTVGLKRSYYDFIGGGNTWKDIFSPDDNGDQGVAQIAYTATFGGGFAATIAIQESQYKDGFYDAAYGAYTELGNRAPDIIAALDLTQGWGAAHLAVAAHENSVQDPTGDYDKTEWGFGVIGGLQFNLPQLGAGDLIQLQAAYADGASKYSGISSPGWSGYDQGFNPNGGNGTEFPVADGIWLGSSFKLAESWTIAAQGTFQLTPNFAIDPEIAYGHISYNSAAAAAWAVSRSADAWVIGSVFDWSPVKNLDFALDVMYESSHQEKVWEGTGYSTTPTDADGVNFRLHIIRAF